MSYFFIYYLAINTLTFLLFSIDKYFAIKRHYRIPEFTLLLFCVAGGSAGGGTSMLLFRHKIRKFRFAIFVPALLLLQIYLFTRLT